MTCDCEQGRFDCEQRVRCFVGDDAARGRAALDELIEKVKPLIWGVVNRKLRSTPWWQDREDVVQTAIATLCKRGKVLTWLAKQDSGKGAPFCRWIPTIAYNCAIDWIRDHPRNNSRRDDFNGDDGPDKQRSLDEQAARLREAIRNALAEFPIDWQLIFFMRFSYLDPTIAGIQRSAGVSERTVHYRRDKIIERILACHAAPISQELAKRVGTRHPVDRYDQMSSDQQAKLNRSINQFLSACPIEEQLAFYARYSLLALEVDEIAHHLGEDAQTVRGWLHELEVKTRKLSHTAQTPPPI